MVWEDPLEKEIAAHSSIFAWEIPWTKEPGGEKYPVQLEKKKITLVFIYVIAESSYLLTAFMQHLLPSLFTSGNHKSDLFFFFS